MSVMIAFGLASIMLLLGVICRAKIPFLRNMLVPSAVIAGILGVAFMNICDLFSINLGTDSSWFTQIVNQLFIISFISLTLMTAKDADSSGKKVFKGAWAIGLIWCLLFTITPLIGSFITFIGDSYELSPIYGMLIQFAFCMGPGQSTTYGGIIEGYGWNDAVMVALTFSSLGFIVAYLIGIPAAKRGIKKGLAKHNSNLDEAVLRGYLKRHEQTAQMKKDTTVNSNIESLAFHFAIIGMCYIMAIGISKIFALLPGYLGTSLSSLMFLNGMYAAYIVKFFMKRLGIDYFLNDDLQM